MWSARPALAHEVMTADCVQWSGMTAALDVVVGPSQQEAFVTAYRAEHPNVFRPRVVVNGASAEAPHFAYLWDVERPDGSLWTGIDVNSLENGLIKENWTFVSPRHCDEDPRAPGDALSADELERETTKWLTDRERSPHRRLVLDPARGLSAALYELTQAEGSRFGGVELLVMRAGRLESIWSLTGTRGFRY